MVDNTVAEVHFRFQTCIKIN